VAVSDWERLVASKGFELTVQDNGEGTVQVAVAGAIDMSSAYDFDDALRRVERDAPARLVLDLRGLEFMDTAGLSRLVALHTRCRRASRRLTLVRGPRVIERLLALARLDDQFEVVGDPVPLR
jgi:anti-sigma B factor antagonist